MIGMMVAYRNSPTNGLTVPGEIAALAKRFPAVSYRLTVCASANPSWFKSKTPRAVSSIAEDPTVKSYPKVVLPVVPPRNPGPGSVMIVFANAKVATQQIKAAIEGALKLGIETGAWGSNSDMPSIFFKNFIISRMMSASLRRLFALVRAICVAAAVF
jgi:hypothetical protein